MRLCWWEKIRPRRRPRNTLWCKFHFASQSAPELHKWESTPEMKGRQPAAVWMVVLIKRKGSAAATSESCVRAHKLWLTPAARREYTLMTEAAFREGSWGARSWRAKKLGARGAGLLIWHEIVPRFDKARGRVGQAAGECLPRRGDDGEGGEPKWAVCANRWKIKKQSRQTSAAGWRLARGFRRPTKGQKNFHHTTSYMGEVIVIAFRSAVWEKGRFREMESVFRLPRGSLSIIISQTDCKLLNFSCALKEESQRIDKLCCAYEDIFDSLSSPGFPKWICTHKYWWVPFCILPARSASSLCVFF